VQAGDVFLCGGVCLVATALFLAMALLVWIQPHLLLDGKQLFVIRIFFSFYMMNLFLWGIL